MARYHILACLCLLLSGARSFILDIRRSAGGHSSLGKRASGVDTSFHWFDDFALYYVNVNIGSNPSQAVKLWLSAGGYPTVVPRTPQNTSLCSTDDQNDPFYNQCLRTNWSSTYDPARSNTFAGDGTVKNHTQGGFFNNGNMLYANGVAGSETFTIGQTTVDNVTFILADNFTVAPQLGLDPDDTGTTFLERVSKATGNIMSYSVYLNDFGADDGLLTFGSVDVSKYSGNLTTFDSTLQGSLVQIDEMSFFDGESNTTMAEGVIADIKFGSTSIWLKLEMLTQIRKLLNAKQKGTNSTVWFVPCKERWSKKYITVATRGITFKIDISQFLIPSYLTDGGPDTSDVTDEEPACRLLVEKVPPDPKRQSDVILGYPFLRAAYVVYDRQNSKTSIAPAILNVTAKNLVPLKQGGVLDTPELVRPPGPVITETKPGTPPAPSGRGSSGKSKIIGGVVGGIIAMILFAAIIYGLSCKQKRSPPLPCPPRADVDIDVERQRHQRQSELLGSPGTLHSELPGEPTTPHELPEK